MHNRIQISECDPFTLHFTLQYKFQILDTQIRVYDPWTLQIRGRGEGNLT